MNPGTSARYSSGTLNASHSQMNRAALSAESTNSTPPRTALLFATMPTGRPSIRANPVTSSAANSGLTSKNESVVNQPVDHGVDVEGHRFVRRHSVVAKLDGCSLRVAVRR